MFWGILCWSHACAVMLINSVVGMWEYTLLMSKDADLISESMLMSLRSVISCVGFFILNAYGSGM
jgi:hypothetical protein